jgi:hypothetical protein
MPEDSSQFFYECEKCKTVIKSKQGDCCVYCSYRTLACPPVHENKKGDNFFIVLKKLKELTSI